MGVERGRQRAQGIRRACAAAGVLLGAALGPAPARAAVVPPFTLFGWVSPPASFTTDVHVAEMADAGLTLMLPSQGDPGLRDDNLVRLDLAAAHGLKCIVWDSRFERVAVLGDTTPAGAALLDSIVADYRDHPAFFGYYLGDEPTHDLWPLLGRLFAELRARDPAHPAWNNLVGRGSFADQDSFVAELRAYVALMHPAVLCDDYYEFTAAGDRGLFFENLSGLAAVARAAGLPFWYVGLLVQHIPYRQPTPEMVSWQAGMALAYGARGFGYFTWWTPHPDPTYDWAPAVIDTTGQRTRWYPYLAGSLDPLLRAAGETLAPLQWLATGHAGDVPAGATAFAPDPILAGVEGRAVLGRFRDAAGREVVMVVNADSLSARTIVLDLAPQVAVDRLGSAPDTWLALAPSPDRRVPLDLPAGGFAVLRFTGALPLPGPPLQLAAVPSPARGTVRFSGTGLAAPGTLEILDSGGRRIWSAPVSPGDVTRTWSGQRNGAGRVRPGSYFARLSGGAAHAVRRFVWLGN